MLGDPFDIAVGKFSTTDVTDGIVIGTVLPDVQATTQTPSRVTLLSATGEDGRNWETRFYRDFRHEWELVRTGNANNTGLDEVVLVDEGLSVLSVYRIDNGMSDPDENDEADRIFNNGSENKKWNDAIVAHSWEQMNQLVAVRNAPLPLASFIVFQYQNADDEWIDLYTWSPLYRRRCVFLRQTSTPVAMTRYFFCVMCRLIIPCSRVSLCAIWDLTQPIHSKLCSTRQWLSCGGRRRRLW